MTPQQASTAALHDRLCRCVEDVELAKYDTEVRLVTSLTQARRAAETPLIRASRCACEDTVANLLAAGACPNQTTTDHRRHTALWIASLEGHTAVAALLISGGATVDQADASGATPLYVACYRGRAEMASMLIRAGAEVNRSVRGGFTPMYIACLGGRLSCVQLLSCSGADRNFTAMPSERTVEQVATRFRHDAITTWLIASRQWSTPLHHLAVLHAASARTLLRAGASIHAAATPGGPTPISLAKEMRITGKAVDDSAAALVLAAAQPWSPATHELFPAAARAFAVEMVLVGSQLARLPSELWVAFVMPHLISREHFVVGAVS